MCILLLCRRTKKPLSSSAVCEARVKKLSREKEKQQILGEFGKTPKMMRNLKTNPLKFKCDSHRGPSP